MEIIPAYRQVAGIASAYNSMREMMDPGPTGGEQWRAQQYWRAQQLAVQERNRQFSEAKGLMSMMLQNYQAASNDPFLQENIQKSMMALHGRINRVDPGMGKLLEAFTNNTPGSKKAYETMMWMNANPAPQITATWEEDPQARAHQEFAMADWRAAYSKVASGQVGPQTTILPTGLTQEAGSKEEMRRERLYAVRDKSGSIRVMSDGQIGLRTIAKDNGTTEAALLANGGVWGEERVMEINGKQKIMRPFLSMQDLMNPEAPDAKVDAFISKDEIGRIDTAIKTNNEYLDKQYANLHKDFAAIAAGGLKTSKGMKYQSPIAQAVHKALEDHDMNWVIENILKPRYNIPGLQIVGLNTEEDVRNWWNPREQFLNTGYGSVEYKKDGMFGYFIGKQLTTVAGNLVPYYLVIGNDGQPYMVDMTRQPVKNPEAIIKQYKIRMPRGE